MRISDWSSDVCSSDLQHARMQPVFRHLVGEARPSFAPACGPSQVVLAQALPVAGVGLRDPFGEWTPAPGRFPLQYVFEIRQFARTFHLRVRGEDLFEQRRTRARSEEHTSELQSLMRISYAVFCLKKKKNKQRHK